MNPELKSIASVDVDDLTTWQPDGDDFSITLDLEIGVRGEPGADLFHLYVTSPAWLQRSLAGGGMADGRHTLITTAYGYAKVLAWIDGVLARCAGADWAEISARLARYFAWEYEDYERA